MAKRFYKKQIAYAGKRIQNGRLYASFQFMGRENESLKLYRPKRDPYIIGQIYDCKLSKDDTLDFNSMKATDEYVDEDLILAWSTRDAADRRAQSNESAGKKLQKKRRDYWLERLEPLRREYRTMGYAQRRAIQQLLIEWLNE